jgi:hypothetical protein
MEKMIIMGTTTTARFSTPGRALRFRATRKAECRRLLLDVGTVIALEIKPLFILNPFLKRWLLTPCASQSLDITGYMFAVQRGVSQINNNYYIIIIIYTSQKSLGTAKAPVAFG